MKKLAVWAPLLLLAAVPHAASAAFGISSTFQIVPKGCDCISGAGWGCVLELIGNLLNFMISIGVLGCVAILAYGGFLLVMNPVNAEYRTQARGMFMNAIVGFIIALSAWLIVNTLLNVLTGKGVTPWTSELVVTSDKCLPIASNIAPSEGKGNVSGDAGNTVPGTGAVPGATMNQAGVAHAAKAAKGYQSQLCSAAQSNGLSASSANQLFGILGVESDGQASVVSNKGAVGLMQLLPGTARGLDSSLSGLSDTQIAAKLRDPSYNVSIGTKYYAQLYSHFSGNTTYATAAYNAGTGTGVNADGTKQPFAPSSDCPGQYAWQCPINPGGFVETQKYVGNVGAVATAAGTACSY